MKKQRTGINLLLSQFRMYCEMETDEEKVAYMDAIFLKQFYGIEPDLSKMPKLSRLAYSSEKHALDASLKGFLGGAATIKPPENIDFPLALEAPLEGSLEAPSEQVQDKVQEQVKEKDKVAKAFNFKTALLDLGGDKQLIEDWLKVRNKKKASNTQTAFKGFQIQVNQSSLHINQILKECAERSWAGFKAEWLEKEEPKSQIKNPYYD